MKKYIIIVTLLLSSLAKADSVQPMSRETNQAIAHLSYCSAEFSQLVTDGALIANVVMQYMDNGSYGYTYYVVRRSNFTEVVPVGSIQLVATIRDNPPTDASRHILTCQAIPAPRRYP